jgi:hypothetical protein
MPSLSTHSIAYLNLRGHSKLRITDITTDHIYVDITFTSSAFIRDCSLVHMVRSSTHPRTILSPTIKLIVKKMLVHVISEVTDCIVNQRFSKLLDM